MNKYDLSFQIISNYAPLCIYTYFISFSGTYGSVDVTNDTESENDALLSYNCSTNDIDFQPSTNPTNLADIPAKEIIIVILMLSLWIYSIVLTRRAWYQFLKE